MHRAILLLPFAAVLAGSPALAEQRRFPATGFDRVAVAGSDNVTIRQGQFAVVADGPTAELDRLDIRVENGTLKIGRKKGDWRWNGKDLAIAVTLPALHGLAVAGSADVSADRGSGNAFSLSVTGSGNATLAALDTASATVSVTGSGDAAAAGRCGTLALKVAGSGNARLSGLRCTNASISVLGSGDASANVSGQASVSVAGSGDVVVTGGGRCTSKTAGSGTVRCG